MIFERYVGQRYIPNTYSYKFIPFIPWLTSFLLYITSSVNSIINCRVFGKIQNAPIYEGNGLVVISIKRTGRDWYKMIILNIYYYYILVTTILKFESVIYFCGVLHQILSIQSFKNSKCNKNCISFLL